MDKYVWKTIGHKPITNFLGKSITNQKLSHAYLFYGPKSIGKNHLANRLAQILQCSSKEDKPCERCPACQQIKKNIHPDVYKIIKEEGKKNISIEQIRELQSKLSLTSFTNSYKIAIIERAQGLSHQAWNSLLKTLEEPTSKTVIILITDQIKQIPSTIVSRSQVLRFNPISVQEIEKYLNNKLKIEKKQAEILAHLSFGRIGQAINFVQNPKNFIDYKNKIKEFLQILSSNFSQNSKLVESYISPKMEFTKKVQIYQNLLQAWNLIIRDLALLKHNQKNLVNTFAKIELEKLQSSFTPDQLKNILQKIEKTKGYLSANVSPKLAMENLLLQI